MTAPTIGAIETEYRDTRFRSRLEARWAVFFDELGIPWEYESEGYELLNGRYLPDFWLPEQGAFWEIKGVHSDVAMTKGELLSLSTGKIVCVTNGSPWDIFPLADNVPNCGIARVFLYKEQFIDIGFRRCNDCDTLALNFGDIEGQRYSHPCTICGRNADESGNDWINYETIFRAAIASKSHRFWDPS
jgi:hypothetical protein